MFEQSEIRTFAGFKRAVDLPEDKVYRVTGKDGEEQEMDLKDIYEFLLSEAEGGMFTTILEKTLKQMGFKNDLMNVRNNLMETVFQVVDDYRDKNRRG